MIQKRLKQNINTSAIIDNTGNQQEITQLKIDVANNTQSITNNSQEIGTLQTQVSQNTQDIAGFNQITTDLETKYNGLESKVTTNQTDIADIKLDADKIDPLVTRVNNIENKYVKKDESNTFSQTNTFNNETNFKRKIEFRNPNNNNGAYLDNFDYYNENYTAFKLIKGGSNMLQIECNNTRNYVNISAPNTNNGLHISNVATPTNGDNATNKTYVDNLNNAISGRVTNIETSLANGNIVNYVGVYDPNTTYKIGQCVTFNDKWYVSKINGNVGNQPNTSTTQWELLSAPTIDLNAYLTKTDASSTYETIANVNALTTKVTTNQTNIANKADASALNNLTTRVDTIENKYVKKDEANTFTANNIFNNVITTTGLTTSSNSDLSLTANGSGRIQIHRDMLLNSHWIAGLADPNSPQDAATKHYVDTQNNNNAKLAANNTFSGTNTFNNPVVIPNPTTANQAANKGYVDNLLSKDINNEQLAPFKIGTTNVYMKYIDTPIRISSNAQTTTPIPNATGINKLVQCNLSTWGGQVLPWYSGTVKLFLLVENGVLKLQSEQGAWVTGIQGVIYYTK